MAEEATSSLRRVTFSYLRIQRASFIGERWASTGSICRSPDNPTGVRPGENIEDAERAPLEHLLFGTQAEIRPESKRAKGRARGKKAARQAESEPEYVYDPVTNRKVPRPSVEQALSGPGETATPNTSFKSYRTQFSSLYPPALNGEQAPIFYDGPPPPAELEKYSQVKIDPHPWETNSVLGGTSSTPSVPDIVNALENMQKEALGYESDVVVPKSGLSPTGPYIPAAVETAPPRKAGDRDGLQSAGPESFEVDKERAKYTPFRSHEPDGKYNAVPEQADESGELTKYQPFRSHEPDGKYKSGSENEPLAELSKYKAVRSHEPDGMYAVSYTDPNPDPAEIDHYSKPYLSHEPDGKYAASHFKVVQDDAELAQYQPFRSHEPDGKYAAEMAKQDQQYDDVDQYQAGFRSHEPDGKYAAEMAKQDEQEDADRYQEGFRSHEPDGKYAREAEQATEDADLGSHEAFNAGAAEAQAVPPSTRKTEFRRMVEDLMARAATEPDSLAPSSGSDVRSPQTVTGTKSGHAQPQVYKILAYDPVMQVIDTAETTSIVPDSSVPLTPAEAILRVSNPARFFPHFAPLRAQGFEIVSGSGDVLIFRKVRDVDQAPEEASKIGGAAASSTRDASVNPIDMTGGSDYTVAAGRFASPTGFVNYDLPPAGSFTKANGPGSMKRGIRPAGPGEAVSKDSGEAPELRQILNAAMQKQGEQAQEKKGKGEKNRKTSVPKRLVVGAVSQAGISYSLGVAGDRLKQGRVEVKTPNPNKL